MKKEDFKESIIKSEHPMIKLIDWCFVLIDEEVSNSEISTKIYKFLRDYGNTLKQDINPQIPQVIKHIKDFRLYKLELLETLKSDKKVEDLINMVYKFSERGYTKENIYDIFTMFHSYVYYRLEIGDPEFNEYDADLIADAVLDGLWGGGWDKGNRLLPDEPDVADLRIKRNRKK
jgi:hypothetical protein